ncbi:MAG: right-handed parallel beta-helix repeat-containing protein [Candidatus Omnitrophica bacterium]|nr:right-handed parallel beta-helix repeat-containing protein [Candidatus Omnitrophota bacterium]
MKAGKWYFRQLFVDGHRAIRARTPNADDKAPWWHIRTSTAPSVGYNPTNSPPPEDLMITASVTGPIKAYHHPHDVELVYIANNNGSRKFLGDINEKEQTFTLPPPQHWNPKAFGTEWIYNIPCAGLACYLENALEMLDEPGEWYLDRETGVLTYWPRAGEDLTRDEVVAPVVPKTLLAVIGTRERPVTNLHFKGLQVSFVKWDFPPWGYLGMAVCTMAVGGDPNPGWRFVDASVEYEYARSCGFTDGAIAHVGSIGLCLRRGTADIVIEGNDIFDLGGAGIGAGYMENAAYGYVHAPPPEPNEFKGYRIANNHVHQCGTDDYGAPGILLSESRDSIVAHNLIHDTAYFGIGFAGSQGAKVPFASNNVVEYNEIYNAMKVTVDGAGLYDTFDQADESTLIRGNLVHDIGLNRFSNRPVGPYSAAGIYLDGRNSGCRYEQNVSWNATSPLFGYAKERNTWVDNIFLSTGSPPREFLEAVQSRAGLEPAYERSLLNIESKPYDYYPLTKGASTNDSWTAYEFNRPQTGQGVVEVFVHAEGKADSVQLKLRGLEASARYEMQGYASAVNRDTLQSPDVAPLPLGKNVSASGGSTMTGGELMEQGMPVSLAKAPQIIWIVYQRAK